MSSSSASEASSATSRVGSVLLDPARPLKERFRALFTLRNLADAKRQAVSSEASEALGHMTAALSSPHCSALLKHEVAYCLGQSGQPEAVPALVAALTDSEREDIVRHEAGEALGAIGDTGAGLEALKRHIDDPVKAVRDTCILAVDRIEYFRSEIKEDLSENPYNSVDPAPPLADITDEEELGRILLDEEQPLFKRYRAMFSLRNLGTKASVAKLGEGLKSSNALFRHEIAYVLGQVQSPDSVDVLLERLRQLGESDMVRHECAEALGSIGAPGIDSELSKYLGSEVPAVLRESCVVALDFSDYNSSPEFQYANTLAAVE